MLSIDLCGFPEALIAIRRTAAGALGVMVNNIAFWHQKESFASQPIIPIYPT